MSKWQLTELGKDGVRETLRPIVEREYAEEDQAEALEELTAEMIGAFQEIVDEVGLVYDDEYGLYFADEVDYMTNIDIGKIRYTDFAVDYEWELV